MRNPTIALEWTAVLIALLESVQDMEQVTFIIHEAEEGGFWAEAEGLPISTQGDDLDELEAMIRDAVQGYFFDAADQAPKSISWRFAANRKVA